MNKKYKDRKKQIRTENENEILRYTLRNIICIMCNNSVYKINDSGEIIQEPNEDFSIPFFERYIKNILYMCEENRELNYDIRGQFDYIDHKGE